MKHLFTTIIFFASITLLRAQNVPTIDQVADQTVDEDAPEQTIVLSGITDGDDGSQTLNLSVSTDNQNLFSKLEIVTGTDTTIVYQPAADSSGIAEVTVSVTDDDGTTDMTFKVTVNEINDPPTIDPIADVDVYEDTAYVKIIMTGISAGPPNEPQDLIFSVYSSNQDLLDSTRILYTTGESTGILMIYVSPDSTGYTDIEVKLIDDNILNGTATTFKLTVLPVNDPPLMDPVDDVVIDNDGAEHTIDITGIAPGPGNESDQTVSLTFTNDNSSLFSDISLDYTAGGNTATLRYTPAAQAEGIAHITLSLSDDGGTLNGGEDLSEQTFSITVSTTTFISETHNGKLTLYPNPVSDLLHINVPDNISKDARIRISDMSGKEIISTTINNGNNINVSNLPKGVYSVLIIDDNNILTAKFIVK
ncbi:MAG: T9SS type A sorting domain-containing protein [Chlorobi bacterium]|nr:T9SS type A sorting domain-containing protein [Chlorobiota bacterium]